MFGSMPLLNSINANKFKVSKLLSCPLTLLTLILNKSLLLLSLNIIKSFGLEPALIKSKASL